MRMRIKLNTRERKFLTLALLGCMERVKCVKRTSRYDYEEDETDFYLEITLNDETQWLIPLFRKKKEWFKNMELNKGYKLQELGVN